MLHSFNPFLIIQINFPLNFYALALFLLFHTQPFLFLFINIILYTYIFMHYILRTGLQFFMFKIYIQYLILNNTDFT